VLQARLYRPMFCYDVPLCFESWWTPFSMRQRTRNWDDRPCQQKALIWDWEQKWCEVIDTCSQLSCLASPVRSEQTTPSVTIIIDHGYSTIQSVTKRNKYCTKDSEIPWLSWHWDIGQAVFGKVEGKSCLVGFAIRAISTCLQSSDFRP